MHATKTLLLLTSCAFALLAPPPAFADYFGLEVIDRTDLLICENVSHPDIPQKLDVCEVHVVFDDPTDRLISVAFTNVSTTAPQGFFQHPLNFVNTAPACALIALEPTVECDSFVTLGLECDRGGSTTDPDFDSTKFNTLGEVSGGWYNSAPSNGQGAPDANGRVMIGRFSYKQNKNTTGDVCIFTQLAGSNDIIEFLLVPFDCSVPGGGLPAGGGGVGGPFPECGPGAGSCLEPNGTPGCDCIECCERVCLFNPFCCLEGYEPGWDEECVAEAANQEEYCGPACGGQTQEVMYVRANIQIPPQDQDGLSWATAFADLQDALTLARCCDSLMEEMWVAAGTYLPSDCANEPGGCTTVDRDATFDHAFGLKLYGGFPADGGNWFARDPEQNLTILSGDLNSDDVSGLGNFLHCYSGNGVPWEPDSGCGSFDVEPDGDVDEEDGNITENVYHVVTVQHGDADTVIDGFTITAGNSLSQFNLAAAGITVEGGPSRVANCVIAANVGRSNSGAFFSFSAHLGSLSRSKFLDNLAINNAGALGCFGVIMIDRCEFINNEAHYNAGAVTPRSSIMSYCLFQGNRARGKELPEPFGGQGGGAARLLGSPKLFNCVFLNNSSDKAGGAIFNAKNANSTIANCLFYGNQAGTNGGAVWSFHDDGDAVFVNCTFADNEAVLAGGGLYGGDVLKVRSSLLWSNVANGVSDEAAQINAPGPLVVVDHSCIMGMQGGGPWDTGSNTGLDPLFVDAVNGDYRLLAGSSAIDAGNNNAILSDAADLDDDGNTSEDTPIDLDPKPRRLEDFDTDDCIYLVNSCGAEPIVDMGAYEFFVFDDLCEPCPTDVDDSGNTGAFDLAILLGNWGGPISDPDVLCLDADGDLLIGAFDLAVLLGNWGLCL